MRVDAHAHVVQEDWVGGEWWDAYADEAARQLEVPAESVRELIVPAMFDEDGSSQLASMETAGLDVAVAFPFDWTRAPGLSPATVGWREQNAWYERFAARNPGRIRWGFGADPRHDGALDAFVDAVESRDAICLKLHPGGGFRIDDAVVQPFLERARDLGTPIVVHVGPLPPPLDGSGADPALLARVVERYPDVPFLAGHCGNEAWRETVEALRPVANVSVDLSGWQARYLQDPAEFYLNVRAVVDAFGPERVLWGTDPPHYRGAVPDADWVAAFADAPSGTFGDGEVEAILGGSAAGFYGLE